MHVSVTIPVSLSLCLFQISLLETGRLPASVSFPKNDASKNEFEVTRTVVYCEKSMFSGNMES